MQPFSIIHPQSAEEFKDYFHFRWQQLRQPLGLPPGSEQDQDESQSFHCMAVTDDLKIIGVGRIHQPSAGVMRIRFMAIDECVRGMGVGSALLKNLLEYASLNEAELCWLNARESACRFYQKHGFDIIEKTDTDLNIPHFRMEKRL
ncbi:MAG: GNAT family N-acetyltransferase [Pseudomonadota bacterium]